MGEEREGRGKRTSRVVGTKLPKKRSILLLPLLLLLQVEALRVCVLCVLERECVGAFWDSKNTVNSGDSRRWCVPLSSQKRSRTPASTANAHPNPPQRHAQLTHQLPYNHRCLAAPLFVPSEYHDGLLPTPSTDTDIAQPPPPPPPPRRRRAGLLALPCLCFWHPPSPTQHCRRPKF